MNRFNLRAVAIVILSGSFAAANCTDFSGEYSCPGTVLKISQNQCSEMKIRQEERGLISESLLKTDGYFHQFVNAGGQISFYISEHQSTEFKHSTVWQGPYGAITQHHLFSLDAAGDLVVNHELLRGEGQLAQKTVSICVRQ